MTMNYWKNVYKRLRRNPPSCEVTYIQGHEQDEYMWVFFTRPESYLEWAISHIGTLLGRNVLTVCHVCFSFSDIHGKMLQFDTTFDGVYAYHNSNPMRDVVVCIRVPFHPAARPVWARQMETIMRMNLRVHRSDWWRWLLGLPVNLSCTSLINFLLYGENKHLDPDKLYERLQQR